MTAEKVNCPRCGVIQVKSDECIVCGYSFSEGNGNGNQRKKKLFSPPREKKQDSGDKKKKTRKKKFKGIPTGVAGVRTVYLTPGLRFAAICLLFVVAVIWMYFHTLGNDMGALQNTIIIDTPRISPRDVPKDQLAEVAAEKIKSRLVNAVVVRGNEVVQENISIAPAEMTTAFYEMVKNKGYSPEDFRVVKVSGMFTFRWLGISWGSKDFSLLGGYNTAQYYKEQEKLDEIRHRQQKLQRESIERRLLNIRNELPPTPPVQPVSQ